VARSYGSPGHATGVFGGTWQPLWTTRGATSSGGCGRRGPRDRDRGPGSLFDWYRELALFGSFALYAADRWTGGIDSEQHRRAELARAAVRVSRPRQLGTGPRAVTAQPITRRRAAGWASWTQAAGDLPRRRGGGGRIGGGRGSGSAHAVDVAWGADDVTSQGSLCGRVGPPAHGHAAHVGPSPQYSVSIETPRRSRAASPPGEVRYPRTSRSCSGTAFGLKRRDTRATQPGHDVVRWLAHGGRGPDVRVCRPAGRSRRSGTRWRSASGPRSRSHFRS
jgi:hypothetical protein